jgi:methyltransferase (TIGR00027 family)
VTAVIAASLTARVAAAYRARATARADALCHDPWAHDLVGGGHEDLLARGDSVAPEMEAGIAVRTAWLDDAVRSWNGRQLVLLGAGLDTRAARLARPGLRFFEVDHPETQAYKRERLAAVAGYPPGASTLVPCDFEKDDFVEALFAAGYDESLETAFVWEGVIAYLTEPAVRATFRKLARLNARRIHFDYIGKSPRSGDGVAEFAGEAGEPFIFTVDDIAPLVKEEGFASAKIVTMREAHLSRVPRAGKDLEKAPFFDRWYLAEALR